MSYTLQNASNPSAGGGVVPLSATNYWSFPNAPGEPPNALHYGMVICVPSNITLASACCSVARGQFVTSTLSNRTTLNTTQYQAVMNQKYPNRNNTLFSGTWVNGTLTPASGAEREGGGINWCSMSYTPLSNISLNTYSSQSWLPDNGGSYGQTPQSFLDWKKCWDANVPAEAIVKGNAAFTCQVNDVMTGGVIQGYNFYTGKSAGDRTVGSGLLVKGMIVGGVGYLAMMLI